MSLMGHNLADLQQPRAHRAAGRKFFDLQGKNARRQLNFVGHNVGDLQGQVAHEAAGQLFRDLQRAIARRQLLARPCVC